MVDVALVQPPIEDFFLTTKRTIPYGLASIAAHLEAQGFSVALIDGLATRKSKIIPRPEEMGYLDPYYGRPDISPFALFHNYRHFGYSFAHIAKLVRDSGAFLVGISSLFTPYYKSVVAVVEVVKKISPDCRIVLGGHHATALPETLMAESSVDYVIRGEGEAALPQLAAALKSGRSADCDCLEKIPGLVYRRPDGSLSVSEPAVVDVGGGFRPPASHLLKRSFYQRNHKDSVVVMASRGCPLRCSYCAVSSDSGLPYRKRSVKSILGEIEQALDDGDVGLIDFEDENLTIDRKWFMELILGIAVLRQGCDFELRAMNGLYPPALDEEIVAAMKKAGFKELNLAVGTFDRMQLERFRRPDVSRAYAQVLQLCRKYELEAVSYIIAGAPGQTALTTLDDLLKLSRLNTIIGLSVFYPAPGSLDFQRAADLKILPEQLTLMRSSAIPLSHTTTRDESITLLRLSRIINFIKLLRKNRIEIPHCLGFSEKIDFSGGFAAGLPDISTRNEQGITILQKFFADGIIRGLTPEGELYEHPTVLDLTRRFIENFSVS